MLHGVNPFSPLLIALAGVRMEEIPRFRDTYLFEVSPGEHGVAIHTRTGGGNRKCYCDEYGGWHREQGHAEALAYREQHGHFPDCYPWMNAGLVKKPTYLRDEDDDFDSTYATFFFCVPEKFRPLLADLVALGGQTTTPQESWRRIIGKLEAGDPNDEEFRHAMEAGRPIIEAITAVIGRQP